MEQIVPTVYGSYLQTCQYMKLPFQVADHTTLNEKFQCHADEVLAGTDMPFMQYVAIGNRGHRFTTGADGVPLIDLVQHQPTDGSLYGHLPFILRPLDGDLQASERARYRMRVVEIHGGVRHAAYYLKRINYTETIAQMEHREINNGSVITTPFVPTVSNLNPTPPPINPGGVLVSTGDAVAVTAKVPFTMDAWEINEFLNAVNIIHGDDRYAMITEIALCSGLDKTVTGEFNGNPAMGYTDAIAVQVCAFISSTYAAKYTNSGINVLLDVGAVNPLLFA